MKVLEDFYYMKIIYNVGNSSQPSHTNNQETYNLKMFLLSYYLTYKNVSQDIEIYTNSTYKSVLNELGLTCIETDTNNYQMFEPKLRTIYHCLQKKIPFCFMDHDVFCFKPIEFNSDVTCYGVESQYMFDGIYSHAKKYCSNYSKSFNIGILAFNKITLPIINCFKECVIDVYDNDKNLHRYDMAAIEQILFMNKILENKLVNTIDYFYNGFEFFDKSIIKRKGICHLVGSAKQNPRLLFYIDQQLKQCWPEIIKKYTHLMEAKAHLKEKYNKIFVDKTIIPSFIEKIKTTNQEPNKYNLSVGAIFFNEAPYLKEWLQHYLNRGVEHFYLINDGSNDNFEEVLAPYNDKITLFNVPERKNYYLRQIDLYNYFFLPILHETKWITVCDIDEYIWSPKFLNLQDACKSLEEENIHYISTPMILFGNNGHKQQPSSIVQSFTRRSDLDKDYHNFVKRYTQFKVLAQTSKINKFKVHQFETNGNKKHQHSLQLQQDLIRLNHYRLQSEEKWRQSLLKPDTNWYLPNDTKNLDPHAPYATIPVPTKPTGNYRTMEMFYEFNKYQNKVEDTDLVVQNLKHNL